MSGSEHIVSFDCDPAWRTRAGAQLDRVKPTRKRLDMMSMLATGFLPWGIEWKHPDGFARLPLCDGRYIMCCGHTMSRKVAQAFVSAGLLMAGPEGKGWRPTLVITDAGRRWLSHHWK